MYNKAKSIISKYFYKEIFIWSVIFIMILLPIGYWSGYRLNSNFTIGKVWVVKIILPFPNTSVYIDQSKKITTTKDNENYEIKLSPKVHNVIVSRDGMYPWMKNFEVPSGGRTELSPIFVYINASGQIITSKDSEYYKIQNLISNKKNPTEVSPTISKDGKTKIWIDNNSIMAKTEDKLFKIIQPETEIKNVDFYKDRSDSVIFSTSNAIYVIEIQSEGTQNFMPIYKGVDPYFIKVDQNSMYVMDGSSLMQIII